MKTKTKVVKITLETEWSNAELKTIVRTMLTIPGASTVKRVMIDRVETAKS